MTAWEYVTSNDENLSLLKEALEYTGVDEFYKQTEHQYTYLLLNNTAMKAFMENKGVTDIHDCDMQELKNLLLYHIIRAVTVLMVSWMLSLDMLSLSLKVRRD